MACGKTTLGTALGGSAGVVFVDLDAEVERAAGYTISDIFARSGESEFRRIEATTLQAIISRASDMPGCVIVGCGGGTPCHGDNMARMLGAGTVIWLKASRERTVARLLDAAADGRRPLMAGLDAAGIAARHDRDMALREPHYRRADAVFDSSFLDTADEIARSVTQFKKQFLQ